MTIPKTVEALIRDGKTLTSALIDAEGNKDNDETSSPGKVAEKLFKHHSFKEGSDSKEERGHPSQDDLEKVQQLGNFGTSQPSELFLTIYHDILLTLEKDPWAGVVSPPLMGATGVVNLSIISVIPDIIQHYCDCIVAADDEVILGTNYWENSNSANHISDAFRELSKRAEARGKKVVVKMMYDRGNLKQLANNHVEVDEAEWTSDVVNLPKLEEMRGLDFQLVNYHRPMLGTFHSKYMIVDRKVALLNSNNIQDRPNVEMMIHIEGEIVQSFYDMALYSWDLPLRPALPLLNKDFKPSASYEFGLKNRYMTQAVLDGKKGAELQSSLDSEDRKRYLQNWTSACTKEKKTPCEVAENDEAAARYISGRKISITHHLNAGKQDTTATIDPPALDDDEHEFRPHHLHAPHEPVPMALVNRKPHGRPGHGDTHNPQDVAWLSALKHAKQKVFIQTPTFNAKPVVAGVLEAVRRGVTVVLFVDVGFNDGGEALPAQGGTNEECVKGMFRELKSDDEKARLQYFWYTAKDQKKPINAHINHRNCHVKLMIVDDHIGIQGNGNQDAQSWFHSQEINVMLDSKQICADWMDMVTRNQNTLQKGRLDNDGIWRDEEHNELTDSTGIKSGPSSIIKGVIGSIKRVQGKGGF